MVKLRLKEKHKNNFKKDWLKNATIRIISRNLPLKLPTLLDALNTFTDKIFGKEELNVLEKKINSQNVKNQSKCEDRKLKYRSWKVWICQKACSAWSSFLLLKVSFSSAFQYGKKLEQSFFHSNIGYVIINIGPISFSVPKIIRQPMKKCNSLQGQATPKNGLYSFLRYFPLYQFRFFCCVWGKNLRLVAYLTTALWQRFMKRPQLFA